MVDDKLSKILPGAVGFFLDNQSMTFGELSARLNAAVSKPSGILLKGISFQAPALVGGREGIPGEKKPDRGEATFCGMGVLAANHHGFDTHPEMVQGSILFGLGSALGDGQDPVVVLASSAVPLNNPTNPGGLCLGRVGSSGRRLKARVFPRSRDRIMVSRAPRLTKKDVTGFLGRLGDLADWEEVEKKAAKLYAEKYLLDEDFLNAPNFLAQASKLALASWADRFAKKPPPLFQLDLESLVLSCLKADMANADSAASLALFDQEKRAALIGALADKRGAWAASLTDTAKAAGDFGESESLGTVFFWAVDGQGRRRPMGLGRKGSDYTLRGGGLELPLSPQRLATALSERSLVPGLFLDYLVLAAHGLMAHGGVFMIDYLPALLGQASEILEIPLGPMGELNALENRPLLAAGFQPLGLASPQGEGYSSAGALELFAAGALSQAALRKLAETPLKAAWLFTAGQWYQEEIPPAGRLPGWENLIGRPAIPLDEFGLSW
ncbi:MAG: hypothetical protein LBF58_10430 [Deltaproteobacteria bacterium]|jgi:hypothetical protein|nr:hypothetical protein [Deltaproteobacteria bacterium]